MSLEEELNKIVDINETNIEHPENYNNVDESKILKLEANTVDNKSNEKTKSITFNTDKEIVTNSASISSTNNDKDNTKINEDESELHNNENNINDIDSQWFYVIKNNINHHGDIYNIDKEGNLISKIEQHIGGNLVKVIGDNDHVTDEVKQSINNAKKQIEFLPKQKLLEEEIKGYPEFDEKALQLFNPTNAVIKFKDAKSRIRALLDINDGSLKVLISLIANNKIELFNELKEKDLIPSKYKHYLLQRIYDLIIFYSQRESKMPPMDLVANILHVPYSKEFFDDLIDSDEFVTSAIKLCMENKRKDKCEELAESIKSYNGNVDLIIDDLRDINTKYNIKEVNDTFNDLEEYINSKEHEDKIFTGVKQLDDNNVYIAKGQIGTVFAYTGNFKTMFCTNVAYNSINKGTNVLYISLEISKEEMYINFLSRHSCNYETKISHTDIKASNISIDDKDFFFSNIYKDFRDNLKPHLIVFDESDLSENDYATFDKLLLLADDDFNKQTDHGLDLVIIDHVNLLKFNAGIKTQNDYSAINHWMSYFRRNAINLVGQNKRIAILCAAQSSREGYKDACKNDGYKLTSIAEGNEIERCSQLVLSIYCTNDEEIKRAFMQVLKRRDDKAIDNMFEVNLEPKYYSFGIGDVQSESKNKNDEYNNITNNESMISVFETNNQY